uniref:Uncharacterized protein n=1 Tax=Panagrolaimus sp. PS1159 TaxID=55785 RepID=A0AC35G2J4_9BILA
MNLYNLVDDVYKSTKVPKSNYNINFCRQADDQNPVVLKKGQVPPPPPKQLEITTPTIAQTQTQESVKPQSTVLKTIE